jgi:PPP family 3-phenylpropionic acid transporter
MCFHLGEYFVFRISTFSFFIFASFAVHAFYLPLYLQNKGLSNGEIGLVMGLGSFIAIFAQPFWGLISDRYKTIKRVLAAILLAGVLISVPLFLSNTLVLVLLFMGLFMFFFSAVGPLTESLMFNYAQVNDRHYGSLRLWGEVGIGLSALTLGIIIEQTSIVYLWWMFAIIVAAGFVSMFWLPDAKAHSVPVSKESLARLFSNRTFLLFLGLILLISIPHRMNDTFLPIYIKDLGATESDVGKAWLVATLSAVPSMALIGALLKKRSELFFILFAGFFYILRWIIYSFAAAPMVLIIAQGLHMLTFPLLLVASVQFIHKIIPPELIATGQTIFTAVFFGIGGIVGSSIGGVIMDGFGPKSLYLTAALLCFIGIISIFLCRSYLSAQVHHAEEA